MCILFLSFVCAEQMKQMGTEIFSSMHMFSRDVLIRFSSRWQLLCFREASHLHYETTSFDRKPAKNTSPIYVHSHPGPSANFGVWSPPEELPAAQIKPTDPQSSSNRVQLQPSSCLSPPTSQIPSALLVSDSAAARFGFPHRPRHATE
jgi:hypothetical protein